MYCVSNSEQNRLFNENLMQPSERMEATQPVRVVDMDQILIINPVCVKTVKFYSIQSTKKICTWYKSDTGSVLFLYCYYCQIVNILSTDIRIHTVPQSFWDPNKKYTQKMSRAF